LPGLTSGGGSVGGYWHSPITPKSVAGWAFDQAHDLMATLLGIGVEFAGAGADIIGEAFFNDPRMGEGLRNLSFDYYDSRSPAAKAGWYDPSNPGTMAASFGLMFVNPEGASASLLAAKEVNQVFWSGGRAAEEAASRWALLNNGIIIADTAAGRALAAATEGLPWSQAMPRWLDLSRDFARTASGEVNVFQSVNGVFLNSIWREEYRILMNNPNVTKINYHVVMPDGSVFSVP